MRLSDDCLVITREDSNYKIIETGAVKQRIEVVPVRFENVFAPNIHIGFAVEVAFYGPSHRQSFFGGSYENIRASRGCSIVRHTHCWLEVSVRN
jgi:hypothetical protein